MCKKKVVSQLSHSCRIVVAQLSYTRIICTKYEFLAKYF
ncbi:hypothetical protein HMPREF1493_0508 [Atopobium sp. ICM42b]|nr:hypothetical protein HMPREF1493_0508 [Atopobium sp. ICM42b]